MLYIYPAISYQTQLYTIMMRLVSTLVLTLQVLFLFAQPPCPNPDDISIIVTVQTDQYGYETSWSIVGGSGTVYHQVPFNTYANSHTYQQQVCVDPDDCVFFHIYDSYGDGIFSPGYYTVSVGGVVIASGGNFTSQESVSYNCLPGQVCDATEEVTLGQYTTSLDNHWYSFSPDSSGIYQITTCGFNTCDTKIWVYENCPISNTQEDNKSTAFFDDNSGGCDPQAVVTGVLDPNKTYIIRIGDNMDACGDSITWELLYLGPVVGCTDPTSCNFNPLATIDDGSCIPQGSPDCPDGPDLELDENLLRSSVYLSTINSTDACYVQEGCTKGYGLRNVVRFSTKISNIGEKDYFIGSPSISNPQFTWGNCHNHFHYDGYAEYILFDQNGVPVPAGLKNGFCVLDLGCTTGSGQYGCGYMGISAGCYDEYWAGLDCQWVDVTDIPDGAYTLVTRVNWDNAPDALGQVEKDTLNNWGQVCITLDRSSGELEMTINNDCPPVVDCQGTPYGNLALDCNGVCGGTSLRGDLNGNSTQEIFDAQIYVDNIIAGDTEATNCNDLNADGDITVYDASLLASCLNFGASHLHQNQGQGYHNHCNFPYGIVNSLDTATFSIIDVNFDEQYVDIGITNPTDYINAYQFRMSGINMVSVENLVDPAVYPISPRVSMAENLVVGISYQDSVITKSPVMQPLCRIYFNEITANTICLEEVIDVVNRIPEQLESRIVDGCVTVTGIREPVMQMPVEVQPNPFANSATLKFANPTYQSFALEILDGQGRLVRTYSQITGNEVVIERENLTSGVYIYRLHGEGGMATGRFVIK